MGEQRLFECRHEPAQPELHAVPWYLGHPRQAVAKGRKEEECGWEAERQINVSYGRRKLSLQEGGRVNVMKVGGCQQLVLREPALK